MWLTCFFQSLINSPFFMDHSWNLSRSLCNIRVSSRFAITRKSFASSAYINNWPDHVQDGRSFMNIINKIGLRTDPCGTTEGVRNLYDLVASACDPSNKTEAFQTFCERHSWFTVSKAFEKSMYIESTWRLFRNELTDPSWSRTYVVQFSQTRSQII